MAIMPKGHTLGRGCVVIWQSTQGPVWSKELVCAVHSWATTQEDAVGVCWQSAHPCYQPLLVTASLVTELYRGHRDVAGVDEEAKIFGSSPPCITGWR